MIESVQLLVSSGTSACVLESGKAPKSAVLRGCATVESTRLDPVFNSLKMAAS